MPARAFITGLAGLTISANERAFLREAQPWGLIIFKRNVSSPAQVSDLTRSFRDLVGWEAPVLVDQEGGRVQRLGPPHWPAYPPGARYGALYDRDPTAGLAAARLGGRLIAADLHAARHRRRLPAARRRAGRAAADPVIGDRAYGNEPGKVAAIAARHRRGADGGRRAAGAQASAGPWPRHRRQPPEAAGGRHRPRHPGSDRFCRLPPARRACRSA